MEKCICGKKPKFFRRMIDGNQRIKYFYLKCCDIETFSTRTKDFCTELWDSTIKRKISLGQYK